MTNPMFDEWIGQMLERNGVKATADLAPEMIFEEIKETISSIKNEKLWALGASTKASAALHIENMDTRAEYIQFLEALPQMQNLTADVS